MMKNGDACLPEKFNGGITNGANWYELKGKCFLLLLILHLFL